MSVVQEISRWLQKKPGWFSDAVRRVFQQPSLSTDDEETILRNLYREYRLVDADEGEFEILPWARVSEHASTAMPRLLLKEIHDVKHVNALVPGQSLQFALDGLTVVYGENGAGKSGYARILKHACFARDKREPIKPNVQIAAAHRPEAIIEFQQDGQEQAFRWHGNAPSLDVLANVAVFDSHSARVVLDDANEVVYLPYGMDTFPRLTHLFERLTKRIDQELSGLNSNHINSSSFHPSTAAGKLVLALSATTSVELLHGLATLDESEKHRLTELEKLCMQAAMEAPGLRAKQLMNRQRRLERLTTAIQEVRTALSRDRLQAIAALAHEVSVARTAAALAAQPALSTEPLPGSGSDPWKVLFEAARKFSETEAYPGQPFPIINDGALCVLCQQPLDMTARDRLRRFDEFVKASALQRQNEAEIQLQQALDAVSSLPLNILDNDPELLDEVRQANPETADLVDQLFEEARQISAELIAKSLNWKDLEAHRDLPDPLMSLDDIVQQIRQAQIAQQEAEQPEAFNRLQQEMRELKDRTQLKADLELIEGCIRTKVREEKLKQCRSALATTDITRVNSALMEHLVTAELKANLAEELGHYDLPCPPVNVKRLGQKGKAKHQMVIATGDRPSGILSEGEQRLIAIASFLAELKTAKSESPIIFDDPVSSLDHRYRERVAERLVSESKVRQVIVLTHDIVLFLKLQGEAGKQQVPMLIQTITRNTNGPGNCIPTQEVPWPACNTKRRIGMLKEKIAAYGKLQKETPDVYRKEVGVFYGLLRETWERAIEECLLNDVIQRFRVSIETMRLKQVSIEPGDYLLIERNMSKCSTYLTGHDESGALSLQTPSPDELGRDLKELEDFRTTLIKRYDDTVKRNDSLSKAPKAQCTQSRAKAVIELPEGAASHPSRLC